MRSSNSSWNVSRWIGALVVVLPMWFVVGPMLDAAANHVPFERPLFIAPEIVVEAGDTVNLVADEAQVQVLTGQTTEMWLYNGTFPGPTIRQIASDSGPAPVTLNLRNALDEGKGPLTLHHHGNHSTPTNDGRSHNDEFVPDALIAEGSDRDYVFEAWEDGATERGATQWYHDHLHGSTTRNVAMGLAGMYIIDDPNDPGELPSGQYEIPLMLSSAQFDGTNQIVVPDIGGVLQTGNHDLVNGVPQPYFEAEPTLYRFRILNASPAKYYGLQLWTAPEGGGSVQPITVLGTEAGLMSSPIETETHLRMGPAERLDLVFDFTGLEGQTLYLRSSDPAPVNGFPIGVGDLMEIRVGDTVTGTPGSVPSILRDDWPDLSQEPIAVERTFTFDRPANGNWSINNQVFDEGRFDAEIQLGTTEKWTLRNTTNIPHVIHIHDVDHLLVRRLGPGGAAAEAAPWEIHKESWLLPPQSSFEILIRFTDHVGPYLFHCHVLEHEDDGMMSQFLVVGSTTTTTPSTTTTTVEPTTTTTVEPTTTTTVEPTTTTTVEPTTTTTVEPTTTTTVEATTTTTVEATTTTTLEATTTTTVEPTATTTLDPTTTTTLVAVTTTTIAPTTTTTAPESTSRFSDTNGSVFASEIEKLASAGITSGCNPPTNDEFCPEDPVTRGQMAAFLVRALDLVTRGDQVFVDDDGSTFEGDIERLAHEGITVGCNPPANDQFCPEDPVTRGQMAAFLRRALTDLLPAGPATDFTDDNGSTFEDDIEWLSGTGVTRGCNPPSNSRFCPDDYVTRGQMAAFLVRALGLGQIVEESSALVPVVHAQPSTLFMGMAGYLEVMFSPEIPEVHEYQGGLEFFCRL